MLELFKAELAEAAAAMPVRYTRIIEARPAYDHQTGRLHQVNRPDMLIAWEARGKVSGYEDRALHDMSVAGELSGATLARLEVRFDAAFENDLRALGVPQSFRENAALPGQPSNGRPFLALDRQVSVAAMAMDSAQDEHLITRPDLSAAFSLGGTAGDTAVMEGARYLKNVLLIMDLDVAGLDIVESNYVFDTRLTGATLMGTRGEILASYSPEDFPSTQDLYERSLTLEQQRASQELARAEADRRAAAEEEARRAGFDILGVRLGMSMEEARAALETGMEVRGWYRFTPSTRVIGIPGYRPYRTGLMAYGDAGTEVVALYELDGRVAGVARDLHSQSLTVESLDRCPGE